MRMIATVMCIICLISSVVLGKTWEPTKEEYQKVIKENPAKAITGNFKEIKLLEFKGLDYVHRMQCDEDGNMYILKSKRQYSELSKMMLADTHGPFILTKYSKTGKMLQSINISRLEGNVSDFLVDTLKKEYSIFFGEEKMSDGVKYKIDKYDVNGNKLVSSAVEMARVGAGIHYENGFFVDLYGKLLSKLPSAKKGGFASKRDSNRHIAKRVIENKKNIVFKNYIGEDKKDNQYCVFVDDREPSSHRETIILAKFDSKNNLIGKIKLHPWNTRYWIFVDKDGNVYEAWYEYLEGANLIITKWENGI